MDDGKIKKIAAEILRNKDRAFRILDYLRPEDIERGVLALPDELWNDELQDIILDRCAPYLAGYQLTSASGGNGSGGPDGLLFLDLDLRIKQLGGLRARYMFSISHLQFSGVQRRLAFSYREDVKCLGNPLQSMALKALLGDKTLLMKAAEMAGLTASNRSSRLGPIVAADRERAVVDLSRLNLPLPGFLDVLHITYQGAGDGFLRFLFHVS